MDTATFGAGCFWGVEETFRQLDGVTETAVGYAGGTTESPTYEEVCTDTTGHAEVVEVKYDPARVTYEQLLDVFWNSHNPTTLNRQGNDVGTQYRSAIFYHDDAQKELAEQVIAEMTAAQLWPDPIVTEITPLETFYTAEDYHQQYYANNEYQPYCMFVVAPKVQKFRQKFVQQLKR